MTWALLGWVAAVAATLFYVVVVPLLLYWLLTPNR